MQEEVSGDRSLIAAAQAAASWARARRASWTRAPVPVAPAKSRTTAPPPSVPASSAPSVAAPVSKPPTVTAPVVPAAVVPPPIAPAPVAPVPIAPVRPDAVPAHRTHHHEPARTQTTPPSFAAPMRRWLAPAVAAAALAAGAYFVLPYASNRVSTWTTRTPPAPPADTRPRTAVRKTTGGLRVTSNPAAQVLVDGKARGTTPLTIADLPPGRHEVALKSDAGTVRRVVTIAAGDTATVEESIFSGWVTVLSPFEVSIAESGRALRPDDRNQVMLSAGIHELRLANRALAYEAALQVEVKPGETTSVRLTPAPSTLTVTSTDAAEVWVDGTRVGETPLNALSIPLGTHEILVKRASGGERRSTVTIGTKPFAMHVDF